MSNRLLVSSTPLKSENSLYDGIVYSGMSSEEYIKEMDKFLSTGPFKIAIEDKEYYLQKVEPYLMDNFLHGEFPESIWFFYYRDERIEHPTQKELNNFLRRNK